MNMGEALTQVSSLVTTAVTTITGNEVLMVMFVGGLLGIGFKIVAQAKHAARA